MTPKHRRQNRGPHDYPRTARLNELIQQIVAEELRRIDDEALELVTVVAVEAEADLRRATVYVTGMGGPEDDEALVAAVTVHRRRLQAAIGAQARFRRTPELTFEADQVIRSANRIEEILRGLHAEDPGRKGEPGDEPA